MESATEHSQFESVPRKKCKSYFVFYILVALNVIVLALIISALVLAHKAKTTLDSPIKSPIDHLAEEFRYSLPDMMLPDSYAVDTIYRNPATNQANRGTCWAWATIYTLETQYREQGIRQKYLKENEYVKFSVQAYAATLGNFCRAHPTEKVCGYGNFHKGSTDDGQIEALYYYMKVIPHLNISIVPDAVCPYIETGSPETDFKCDGFEAANKTNPIRFTLKDFETVFDVRAVKQLLIEKKRPIAISTPLGTVDYIVRCSDEKYANLSQCVRKSYICPDSQTMDEYCAIEKFDGITFDGTFVTVDSADRTSGYGGHAMNVVGYNDNWIYLNRIAGPSSLESSRGCLILHNSWRADGHSIEYLMGRRTLENEQTSCPNVRTPSNWIPATLECVKNNREHPERCSSDIKRVRGHGLTNGTDVLTCKSSNPLYCKQNNSYVLKRKSEKSENVDVYQLPNGLHSIGFITWNDKTGEEPQEVRIETLPFWSLDRYFKPVNVVENNPDECGFYALPYKTIENFRRRSWDLFDNFKVTDFDIVFDPSSYANAPESKAFDTSYLLKSTYTAEDAKFDGPIPFNLVY
jgi:hypothetical protein